MRSVRIVLAAFALLAGMAASSASAVPITIYDDTNSSGAYDLGEAVSGGANGDPGATYALEFDLDSVTQDITGAVLDITFEYWDNNFIIVVNGVTVVPLDPGDPAVFTPGVSNPWLPNDNALPRLAIVMSQTGIAFSSALTTTDTTMTSGLVYAQPTTNPVFVNGQNTITIVNPDGPGPDSLFFTISGDVPLIVPEPATAALFGAGLCALALASRRSA
jgi:hypothetical protein